MAVSLFQSALTAEANGQFKKAGVIKTFVETSPLLAAMPMLPIQGNSFAWTRQVSLGTAGTRAVNGSYSEGVGAVETRSVGLKIIGGDMDIDQFLLQTHGPEHRAIQEQAKAALIAQTISWQIIKGSVTTAGGATADGNGIDGLQVRYGGGFGSTTVVDGGTLTLSGSLASSNLTVGTLATVNVTKSGLLPVESVVEVAGAVAVVATITATGATITTSTAT
jgi:hypothetical protein